MSTITVVISITDIQQSLDRLNGNLTLPLTTVSRDDLTRYRGIRLLRPVVLDEYERTTLRHPTYYGFPQIRILGFGLTFHTQLALRRASTYFTSELLTIVPHDVFHGIAHDSHHNYQTRH